jgi:outer membrane protein assembly factor BamB
MKRTLSLLAAVVAAVLMTPAGVPAQARTTVSDDATAYQIDPAHDGNLQGDTLTPPLVPKWSASPGGNLTYPLIAGGRVFVESWGGQGGSHRLIAFDAVTGARLWRANLTSSQGLGLAYDGGRLFALSTVIGSAAYIQAFDPATGQGLWVRKLASQYVFSSGITASGGIVYTGGAGSGGTVYAVSESTGRGLWTASVENGDDSNPAVTSDGVYVSYACAVAYRFDPATGHQIWIHTTYCEGGGGKTSVYYSNRLYVRDWATSPPGYVIDAATGADIQRYDSTASAPAFSGDVGVFRNGGSLEARSVSTGHVLWSFPAGGDLSSAPLIVNGTVYIGSNSGALYGLDLATGQIVWSTTAGSGPVAPDVDGGTVGMNAGEGVLVVPVDGRLFVYGN